VVVAGATIDGMTLKEHIHQLVDSLADDDDRLQAAERLLETNGASVGDEAKPGDIIDEWGNLSAMKRGAASRKMKRLSEEEIAANGETLAETWGYSAPNRST
jgi:hypothetical protein